MEKKPVQILDCTLRDGGLGLEDAWKNKLSNVGFNTDTKENVVNALRDANVDIIELGSIEISDSDKERFAIYQNIERISQMMPKNKKSGQHFAALFRGPDTPIENIPNWTNQYCDFIRVIIRYSEIAKSMNFCKELSRRGYHVLVQPMLTMRYTKQELDYIINMSNDMQAYALYFVDSYGYMQEEDVYSLFVEFDKKLNPGVKIGFHAHNNMGMAFANVKSFLRIESERNRIVDSCIMGMGQGAGNLQTEIIADYLNNNYHGEYAFDSILEADEMIEPLWVRPPWGYSTEYLIPAIHKTAYKYSIALRHQYGCTYSEIDYLLRNIPEHLRHRYTPENVQILLKSLNFHE